MNAFNKTIKKSAIPYLVAVFLIAVDRYLKVLSQNLETDSVSLAKNFSFTHAANSAAAFSLPINQIFLIGLIVVIITVFGWSYYRSVKAGLAEWPLVWIVLGAVSNLFDRFAYGGVLDYLAVEYFTVFNLADVMICSAVAILIFGKLKSNRANALRIKN